MAQEGVEVKLVPGPDGEETFILARSADRRAKEQAMHEKFTAGLEEGLKKMQAAAEAGRLQDEAAAGERLGRLKQQNWRASQAFEVSIKKLAQPRGKQHLEITWQRQEKFADWSQHADGCYLLRSNLKDVDAATLVEALHSVDGSGMGLPHHEGRIGDPAHLAPEGRPREGAHPGLLPGLRVVEDAGRLDAQRRPGRCTADGGRVVRGDQERRRDASRPAAIVRAGATDHAALRDGTGRGPVRVASSTGAVAASAAPPPRRPEPNVVKQTLEIERKSFADREKPLTWVNEQRFGTHKTPRQPNYRLRFKVMRRDKFRCTLCRRTPATTLGITLVIDHKIAWDSGGETTYENLQTLCDVCNSGKATSHPTSQTDFERGPRKRDKIAPPHPTRIRTASLRRFP